jgi:hypothetical protein
LSETKSETRDATVAEASRLFRQRSYFGASVFDGFLSSQHRAAIVKTTGP